MSNEVVTYYEEPLKPSSSACVAHIKINRPEQANAFNSDVMLRLQETFEKVATASNIRAVVLAGVGKHFSAGADLGWMKESIKLDFEANVSNAHQLTRMFESLSSLDIPVICVTHGAIYGGAVGLAACSDIVIAQDNSRFCLSEVKLGLLPAVILPYLARRMNIGFLKRAMLTATTFSAAEAQEGGLVNLVGDANTMTSLLQQELNAILTNGPSAVAQLKSLFREIESIGFKQSDLTARAIAKARTGSEGQAGLKAYFNKAKPAWVRTVASTGEN